MQEASKKHAAKIAAAAAERSKKKAALREKVAAAKDWSEEEVCMHWNPSILHITCTYFACSISGQCSWFFFHYSVCSNKVVHIYMHYGTLITCHYNFMSTRSLCTHLTELSKVRPKYTDSKGVHACRCGCWIRR